MNEQGKAEILRRCKAMTQEELLEYCETTLQASAWSQQVLIERFGLEEWQRFNKAIETGRITI